MKTNPSLEKRIADYADGARETRRVERRKARLLAGALLTAGAACAGLPVAEATVVYTDVNPDVMVSWSNSNFKINIAGVNRFQIGYSSWLASGYKIYSVFADRSGGTSRNLARGATVYQAKRFAAGNTIGNAENWQNNWMMLCSTWTYATGTKGGHAREGHARRGPRGGAFDGADGYIGIRFPTGTGTDPKYGWIEFEGANSGLYARGIVKGFAYQDNGTAIHAGEGQ